MRGSCSNNSRYEVEIIMISPDMMCTPPEQSEPNTFPDPSYHLCHLHCCFYRVVPLDFILMSSRILQKLEMRNPRTFVSSQWEARLQVDFDQGSGGDSDHVLSCLLTSSLGVLSSDPLLGDPLKSTFGTIEQFEMWQCIRPRLLKSAAHMIPCWVANYCGWKKSCPKKPKNNNSPCKCPQIMVSHGFKACC